MYSKSSTQAITKTNFLWNQKPWTNQNIYWNWISSQNSLIRHSLPQWAWNFVKMKSPFLLIAEWADRDCCSLPSPGKQLSIFHGKGASFCSMQNIQVYFQHDFINYNGLLRREIHRRPGQQKLEGLGLHKYRTSWDCSAQKICEQPNYPLGETKLPFFPSTVV